MERRTRPRMVARRHFRLDMPLREGGRYGRGTIKVTRPAKGRQRAARALFVVGELFHESLRTIESLDLTQTRDEGDLDELVVEVAVGIEQVGFDGATFVAEGGTPAKVE